MANCSRRYAGADQQVTRFPVVLMGTEYLAAFD